MKISKTLLAVAAALTASAGSFNLHAQSPLPICQSAASDSDGDGYGWENSASCLVGTVDNSSNSNTNSPSSTGGVIFCQSAASDSDGDGYGWENNQSCVVAANSADPVQDIPSMTPLCASANSDPDGDGFGWENNASCVVAASQSTGSTGTGDSTGPIICQSPGSDSDGDGYGWENNQSCLVSNAPTMDGGNTGGGNPGGGDPAGGESASGFSAIGPSGVLSTGTPTFQWNALDNADRYTLAVADSLGNGYAFEVDPFSAGCAAGGICSVTPDLAYYDNDLTWRIKTIVDGADGPETPRVSITTPQNINIQPVKSGQCEAWPSVAYDKYVVLNNTWNSRSMNRSNWNQKIFVNENTNQSTVTPSWSYDFLGQFDGDEIEVKAYPEVLYGPKLGTHISGSKAETGLPELVSSLPEFVVEYAYSETGNAERNVALESFFHDSCNIAGPCDEVDNRVYEMMIWVENPSIRTPGQLALTGVMIDNRLWNVYIKPNSNKHYIAFTAQNSQPSGTINWNRFVEWTQSWTAQNSSTLGIDVLKPEFCMGAIEMGTELWWGAGSFTLDKFDVSFSQ